MSKTAYLTTAIPYVNGAPHVGHLLDYLLADVYRRYLETLGVSVRLQAGTDEHGSKIWNKAASLDLPVQTYVDNNSARFREFIQQLGVTPTDFVRTTDEAHVRRASAIWKQLKPYIYSASYEGWYCSGCERFVSDSEYKDENGVCPDHATPFERLSEKNYYLKISEFKPQIKTAIESGTMRVLPAFRAKEVLNLLEDSPDVSISRPKSSLPWGIPVPGDDSQVMYVWLDALTNYLTVLGFPETDIADFWPPTAMFVGKDILRFHTIILPTILLGLNLPLPKVVLSHGFVLNDGQKMSKSLGNVVDPFDVLARHGLDPLRYFFLRHVDTFADSNFTWDKFEAAYSGELANDLGNLASRLATLCAKNSVALSPNARADLDSALASDEAYRTLMDSFEFSKAFDYVWSKFQALNKRIDTEKPWSLAKTDPETAHKSLESLLKDFLSAVALLAPFLPETSNHLLASLSAPTISPLPPLFPKSGR